MAVALVLDFPEGSKAQYDQVVERMGLEGHLPPGALFHAAGSYEGGWRVIDVWEDLARFERFRDEHIVPNATEVGMKPPRVRVVEVAQHRPGSGADPKLVQVVTFRGMGADGFRELDARVLPDGRVPDAITFHVNGPVEEGWCVIDAWETREARERFLEERVRPAVAGAPLNAPPVFEDLVVEATLRAPARAHA